LPLDASIILFYASAVDEAKGWLAGCAISRTIIEGATSNCCLQASGINREFVPCRTRGAKGIRAIVAVGLAALKGDG
jgi:hypothetical protein